MNQLSYRQSIAQLAVAGCLLADALASLAVPRSSLAFHQPLFFPIANSSSKDASVQMHPQVTSHAAVSTTVRQPKNEAYDGEGGVWIVGAVDETSPAKAE